MEELIKLLNSLPEKDKEKLSANIKIIVTEKYSLLKDCVLNKKNFKLIYLGDIQKRQEEFKLEIWNINQQMKKEYESGKSKKQPYPIVMLEEFFNYFGEMDRNGKLMRFENKKLYPTWETSKRLSYWYRRSNKY